MNSLRKKEIKKMASIERMNYNTNGYGIIDIFYSLESRGYKVIRYPVDTKVLLGFSQMRDDDKIIFSNSSQILSRENFTIAHELGHYILGHINAEKTILTEKYSNDLDEFEKEADFFAANFLVPEEHLFKFLNEEFDGKEIFEWTSFDIARIQSVFNVSYDVILNRLLDLEKISLKDRDYLKENKSSLGVSTMLLLINGDNSLCRSSQIKRVPSEYLNFVIENYNKKLIPQQTLEKALNYFDIKLSDMIDINSTDEETMSDDVDIDALLGGLE